MATERIFDLQSFLWGESDDATRWPKDSFYSWEGIEVRKDLSGTTLASGLVDSGWTIDGDVTYMINLQTIGVGSAEGIVICTNTGKLYLNGTLMHTLATGTGAHNIVRGIGTNIVSGVVYLYFISDTSSGSGKIHRTTANLVTLNVSHLSYTTWADANGASNVGISKSGSSLLFTKSNKVFSISNTEVQTTPLTLPESEEIVNITKFQNNFKIYANLKVTWVQYIWDWGIDWPDYRQEWRNQKVMEVVNDGANDYAVLGYNASYSDLYIISGTQKQELRVNLEAAGYARTLDGYLSIREAIVYISGGFTGESSNSWVFTYGSYYPGTPKSLVQSYSKLAQFTFHCHAQSLSYVACLDWKIYSIEHNNPPAKYPISWYVVSQIYQGNIWEEKAFKKMKVGYKLEADTQIKIYIRTSFLWTWLLARTISDTTKKNVTITENEIKALNIGNFNELQIKAELLSGSSGGTNNKTPKLYRITTFMDVVNNT